MYSEQQAKNGFKTFVVTLSVSLLLFGALYYLITGFSQEIDIEGSSTPVAYNTAPATNTYYNASNENVKGTTTTVFSTIADKPVNARPATVLASATTAAESTESTVPNTGSNTLLGTIMAVGSFSAALYVLMLGPRKFALSGFEREITK